MKRRSLVAGLGTMAALAPALVRAQEPGRQYKLGYVSLATYGVTLLAAELAKAGYVQGRNLTVVEGDARNIGLKAAAEKVVAAEVDVIFAGGDGAALAAQAATKTIPTVAIADNLLGLVSSLARPTGNLTGVNIFASELNGKRQELLIELIPALKRLAIFAEPVTATAAEVEALQKAAVARGIEARAWQVRTVAELGPAVEAAAAWEAGGINALASPLFHSVHENFINLAYAARLPTIFQWPEYVQEGALIAYGPRLESIYRKLIAPRIVRFLRGAKPFDVPAEQPTNFELGINLRTARAMGIKVPTTLLARVDEAVE